MTGRLWLGLLITAGCTPAPLASLPVPPEPPVVVAPKVSPAQEIHARYHEIAMKEPAVVLAPAATPAYVERVTEADRAARAALRPLDVQHRVASPHAVAQARAAVDRLAAIVDRGIGGTGDAYQAP